jgi:hypothetical protein
MEVVHDMLTFMGISVHSNSSESKSYFGIDAMFSQNPAL